jgi:putative proteasome-type protease
MTYCVGVMLDRGLVLMSDTRTNSGVDNFSVYRKMFHWSVPGERMIAVMTAGNLATTQAVVTQLDLGIRTGSDRRNPVMEGETMFDVAAAVGKLLRDTIQGPNSSSAFSATIIVAGQIKGMEPKLFLIYPEGNFIEATYDTPFFQIGEAKYGRPIIVRGYKRDMSFEAATKLLMVSFDSTIKANLSVSTPLDLLVIQRDRFEPLHERRIEEGDTYYSAISIDWGQALEQAFEALADYTF